MSVSSEKNFDAPRLKIALGNHFREVHFVFSPSILMSNSNAVFVYGQACIQFIVETDHSLIIALIRELSVIRYGNVFPFFEESQRK